MNYASTDLFGAIVRMAIDDYQNKPVDSTEFQSARSFLFGRGLEEYFERVPGLKNVLSIEAIREEARSKHGLD